MGKLSDADYESLRTSLQGRALQAMSAIEKFKEQERAANVAAVTVRPKLREAAAIANEIAAMSKPKTAIPIAPGMSRPTHRSAGQPAARHRARDRRRAPYQVLPPMRHADAVVGELLRRMRHCRCAVSGSRPEPRDGAAGRRDSRR